MMCGRHPTRSWVPSPVSCRPPIAALTLRKAMKVIRATEMGFCMGVRRAVQMMEDVASPENPVLSFGTVVHNPLVVERLRERGVPVALTLAEIDGPRVAISAHGVGPQVLEELQSRGLEIIDTTCPIVTRAQQWT